MAMKRTPIPNFLIQERGDNEHADLLGETATAGYRTDMSLAA
jgi:hypothetical protein